MLMKSRGRHKLGILVDPLADNVRSSDIISVRGDLFDAVKALQLKTGSVDIICILAVFEHLGEQRQRVVDECAKLLKTGGKLILTMPHKYVDHILKYLKICGMIDGMSLEQHDCCSYSEKVSQHFSTAYWKKIKHERFQLGLNNIYVFEKI